MKYTYHRYRKAFIIVLLMLFSISFYGQETITSFYYSHGQNKTSFSPYWFLQGNAVSGFSQSDVSVENFFDNLGFGANLAVGYQFNPYLGISLKSGFGSLKGERFDYTMHSIGFDHNDLSYKANYIEFSLNAISNLSNIIGGYKDRTISFNGFMGIGRTQFRSTLFRDLNELYTFGFKDSEPGRQGDGFGKRRVATVGSLGTGVSIKASEAVDFNLNLITHFTSTDQLDGLILGETKDAYTTVEAGIAYKFGIGGLKNMVKKFDEIKVEATPKVLEEKGDMVDYEITGTIPEKFLKKNNAILMQPILVYEGGQTPLNTFTLKGEEVAGEGDVINYKSGGTFTFKDTFKYSPEMNKSKLVIIPLAYNAKKGTLATKKDIILSAKNSELGERELADGVIYTSERIDNKIANIGAEHGYKSEVIISKTANVYFAKNLYNLNWKLDLNKSEKSQKALANLKEFMSRGWEIESINIDGWASPEGEETFNENLSENRAKVAHKSGLKNLKHMLADKEMNLSFNNVDDIKFNVNFHGQDWNGFTQGVKKSNIADKDAIVNVISRAGGTLQKEEEIRNMIVIYPEIETEILSILRRSEISVNAFEPKKSDEDILALSMSNPKALDIYELLYAAHMAKCADKLGIYNSIMDQYPKCWKSKNNAAIIYIKDGNFDKAEALLNEAHNMYPKVALIINNLGVLHTYKGDYEKGESFFLKAQDLGVDVDYNLGVVEIDKGDYEKALTLFGNKTCDYNVALAQILTGQYAKAENNLKCAEGCEGSISYLMAVIGARTNNASMLYENLIKAIKVNDAYKKIAKEDREFLNFEDTLDFKTIVE